MCWSCKQGWVGVVGRVVLGCMQGCVGVVGKVVLGLLDGGLCWGCK